MDGFGRVLEGTWRTSASSRSGTWHMSPSTELPDVYASESREWIGFVFVERNEGNIPDEEFVVTDILGLGSTRSTDDDAIVRYVAAVPKRAGSGVEVKNHFECTAVVLRHSLRSSKLQFTRRAREAELKKARDLATSVSWDSDRKLLSRNVIGSEASSASAVTSVKAAVPDVRDSCAFVDKDGSRIQFCVNAKSSTLEEWCDGELVASDLKVVDILEGSDTIYDGQEMIPLASDDFVRVVAWLLEARKRVRSCRLEVYEVDRVQEHASFGEGRTSDATRKSVLKKNVGGIPLKLDGVDLNNIVTSKRKAKRRRRMGEDSPKRAKLTSTKKQQRKKSVEDTKAKVQAGAVASGEPSSVEPTDSCEFVDKEGSRVRFCVNAKRRTLEEWCDGELVASDVAVLSVYRDTDTIFDGEETIPLESNDFVRVIAWLLEAKTRARSCRLDVYEKKGGVSDRIRHEDVDLNNVLSSKRTPKRPRATSANGRKGSAKDVVASLSRRSPKRAKTATKVGSHKAAGVDKDDGDGNRSAVKSSKTKSSRRVLRKIAFTDAEGTRIEFA